MFKRENLIMLFMGAAVVATVGAIGAGSFYMWGDYNEPTKQEAEKENTPGCFTDKDGKMHQICKVVLKHENLNGDVCIFENGAVCLGTCLVCALKKEDGKWHEVNGRLPGWPDVKGEK